MVYFDDSFESIGSEANWQLTCAPLNWKTKTIRRRGGKNLWNRSMNCDENYEVDREQKLNRFPRDQWLRGDW